MAKEGQLLVLAVICMVTVDALPFPEERLIEFEPSEKFRPKEPFQLREQFVPRERSQPREASRPREEFQYEPREHGAQYKPEVLYKDEPPKPYAFDYGVRDDYTGANYGHSETSNGNSVEGSYQVALPDGRIQIVKYVADHHNGFQAQVEYQGEAKYPEHVPHKEPSYKPDPYKAPPPPPVHYKPQPHKPSYKAAPQFHAEPHQPLYAEGAQLDGQEFHPELQEFN